MITSGCLFVLSNLHFTGDHRQWEIALRSLLENQNFKPQFAGHETFTLRYGWLKKAIDAVIAANKADFGTANSIFTSEQCIAEFGVGKNMVHSMRHWGLATGVLFYDEAQRLDVSPLGRAIFGEHGDPYLEHPASLWLLHWHLAALPGRATTWYWAFNELNESSFDRDLLVSRLSRRLLDLRESGRKELRLSEMTIRRDVECLVRSYLAKSISAKGLHEENLESPITELSLVQPMGVGGGFQFRRGPKSTLPDEVFLYGLVGFWRELYPTRREFSVETLTHDPGSPGRVFLLDDESVAERLANMAELTAGAIRWDESSGLRQVYAHDLASVDALAKIRDFYRFSLHRRAA
jgi:hypothetical protein